MYERPHRVLVDLEAAPSQFRHQTAQGKIPVRNPQNQPIVVFADNLARPMAAHLAGRNAACLALALRPFDDTRGANGKRFGNRTYTLARVNPGNRTLTQIHRIRLRHAGWPPIQFPP
jgi:hypothetical protein